MTHAIAPEWLRDLLKRTGESMMTEHLLQYEEGKEKLQDAVNLATATLKTLDIVAYRIGRHLGADFSIKIHSPITGRDIVLGDGNEDDEEGEP